MAASGVGTKYHVAINGQGYLLRGRGYNKRDAKIFAPRFGTGEMGESDLDLFKNQSRTDFSGGMFQDKYDDLTKSQVIMGGLRNPLNGHLYPSGMTETGAKQGTWESTALPIWTEYKGKLYYFARVWDTGTYRNWLYYYDGSTGGVYNSTSSPALPAALMTATLSDMLVFNNTLWVTAGGNQIWSFDGTTWTADTRYGFSYGKVFNGKMYFTGALSSSDQGRLWSRDGGIGSAGAVSQIGDVGDVNRPINCFEVYNHRLYIGKTDGLYAYDGVQISCILDYSKQVDTSNFSSMTVLNGVLYFTTRQSLMKFDGSTVSVVTDISQLGFTKVKAALGYLWAKTGIFTSNYFADNLPAHTSASSFSLYAFDGAAWFGYTNEATQDSNQVSQLYFFNGSIYYATDGQGSGSGFYGGLFRIPLSSTLYGTGTAYNILTVDDSQFDAGFPNVDKVLETLEVDVPGLIAGDMVDIYYRTQVDTSFGTWSSWQNAGQINSSSLSNRIDLWKTTAGPQVFRAIQVRIKVTRGSGSSNLSLQGFSFKYYLSPDQKNEWNIVLLTQGQSDTPLILADNSTAETKTAAQLREVIYQARFSDTPIGFEDIDITTLTSSITNSSTTIPVADTSAFKSSGLIKIDDEIIYYTSKTATQFNVAAGGRGALGTTNTSHSSAATVNMYYRAVVTSIANESVVAPGIVDGVMDSYGNESEINIVLQEA